MYSVFIFHFGFYTLTNLQGSQTRTSNRNNEACFTLLQTYKVLKLPIQQYTQTRRFTLLQTYKVLKLHKHKALLLIVLHSYKLTRFSNSCVLTIKQLSVLHSYKLTRFSNIGGIGHSFFKFYTLTNLLPAFRHYLTHQILTHPLYIPF